jgi:hypothetical protein
MQNSPLQQPPQQSLSSSHWKHNIYIYIYTSIHAVKINRLSVRLFIWPISFVTCSRLTHRLKLHPGFIAVDTWIHRIICTDGIKLHINRRIDITRHCWIWSVVCFECYQDFCDHFLSETINSHLYVTYILIEFFLNTTNISVPWDLVGGASYYNSFINTNMIHSFINYIKLSFSMYFYVIYKIVYQVGINKRISMPCFLSVLWTEWQWPPWSPDINPRGSYFWAS